MQSGVPSAAGTRSPGRCLSPVAGPFLGARIPPKPGGSERSPPRRRAFGALASRRPGAAREVAFSEGTERGKLRADAGPRPGLPETAERCRAAVPGAPELCCHCPLSPSSPSIPTPSLSGFFSRSPQGGRQPGGHCVIPCRCVPRSPMCVAVGVTDGAPEVCEGIEVNFLLKGAYTFGRSFLYYSGDAFPPRAACSPPALWDGDPQFARVPASRRLRAPQALGREAHPASLRPIKTQMNSSFRFIRLGKGTK